MRLLFDQNLSPKLVKLVHSLYADSDHVFFLGLDQAKDAEIWHFAKDNGFVLVTKDADFGDLSTLLGFPPKVIWIRRGNCRTSEIFQLLADNFDVIKSLDTEPQIGLLPLF